MASSSLEGPVSRYLNRRLSRPLARLLTRTPATPNQVSVAAFLLAGGALALLGVGRNIEAGVLIQASSVVDGADGDLARAKGLATRFGGLLDAVLERCGDVAGASGARVRPRSGRRTPGRGLARCPPAPPRRGRHRGAGVLDARGRHRPVLGDARLAPRLGPADARTRGVTAPGNGSADTARSVLRRAAGWYDAGGDDHAIQDPARRQDRANRPATPVPAG